jgi:uncharacterized protein YkwD
LAKLNLNIMRVFLFTLLFLPIFIYAQKDLLNTAANSAYMKPVEQEMIRELNLLRSDPPAYVAYLLPELEKARKRFEAYGPGDANFSLTTTFNYENGRETRRVDTTWHYSNQEELRAIEDLIEQLKNTPALSILQPHEGIYRAAEKHAKDLNANGWGLGHRGSDGSWPQDRVLKFAPDMSDGNENLAARFPEPSARQIVLDLLIDSGIPGYGHRHNMLNPKWTHAACYAAGLQEGMYWWVQNFGSGK